MLILDLLDLFDFFDLSDLYKKYYLNKDSILGLITSILKYS